MDLLLGLLLVFFLGYVGLGLLLLPLQVTVDSALRLVTIPVELVRIAANPRLRMNHALEHATINVIEQHVGPTTLTGLALDDGFLIRGITDQNLVEEAALIGLQRLHRGERRMAIHDRCGTSAAVASFLVSVVFILMLLNLGAVSPLAVVTGLTAAYVVGPLLGRILQRFLTTSLPGTGVTLVGVYPVRRRRWLWPGWWPFRPPPEAFFVRTRFDGRVSA